MTLAAAPTRKPEFELPKMSLNGSKAEDFGDAASPAVANGPADLSSDKDAKVGPKTFSKLSIRARSFLLVGHLRHEGAPQRDQAGRRAGESA
jgi:hypothetical protein